MSEARKFTYDPTIFDVGSMQQARRVALNPDAAHMPEELWGIFSFMCRGADLVRLCAARGLVEKLL